MKKLTLMMMFFAAAFVAQSQNLQTHYDFGADRGYLTTTVEKFSPDKFGSTFFFVDFNYDKKGPTEAYWEIARELKNWDGPLSVHVEYNGGLHTNVVNELFGAEIRNSFQMNNAYLLGCTYTWNAKDFSKGYSLSAMYKNIQGNSAPHNLQLTGVWYLNLLKGKVSFTGFADLWTEKHTVSNDGFKSDFQNAEIVFLSEPQLWYNLNKAFSVGTEVELGYNFAGVAGLNICPTLAAKWTF